MLTHKYDYNNYSINNNNEEAYTICTVCTYRTWVRVSWHIVGSFRTSPNLDPRKNDAVSGLCQIKSLSKILFQRHLSSLTTKP